MMWGFVNLFDFKKVIPVLSAMIIFSFIIINTPPAIAQTQDYEFTVIKGDKIKSDPTAQKILEQIELSKKILAELQSGATTIQLTEQQKFIEEQRKIAKARLEIDLERMNKEYEANTPKNAFARYVSDKPDYMQAFYWDQFNYLNDKVSLAQQQRDLILKNGGSFQEAQQVFIQHATFPKSEVYSVYNDLVDKHNLYVHYAGELDPDKWYPDEALELFSSWKEKVGDRYSNKTESQLQNALLLEDDNEIIIQSDSLESSFTFFEGELGTSILDTPIREPSQEYQEIDTFDEIVLNGQSYDEIDGILLNGVGEFTVSAWIHPDYQKGSPVFTILEKPGVFQLTINNYVEPRQIVQFSVFDGIKWNNVQSFSMIDEEWTHVAGVLKDSSISLYVNGNLEAIHKIGGAISLNSKGIIEKIPLQVKTSPESINVGVQKIITLDDRKTMNYFSGLIDDVLIHDKALPIIEFYEDRNF